MERMDKNYTQNLYGFIKQRLEHSEGFMEYLPVTVKDIGQGYVKAALSVTKQLRNPFGTLHGGCMYAVADSVAGAAAMTYGRYVTTISGHIHYLNSVDEEAELKVLTTEIKSGRTILTYDVAFIDSYENIICKATLEYFALNEIKLEEMNI